MPESKTSTVEGHTNQEDENTTATQATDTTASTSMRPPAVKRESRSLTKAIASLQSRQRRRLRLHQRQRLHQAVPLRKSRQRATETRASQNCTATYPQRGKNNEHQPNSSDFRRGHSLCCLGVMHQVSQSGLENELPVSGGNRRLGCRAAILHSGHHDSPYASQLQPLML